MSPQKLETFILKKSKTSEPIPNTIITAYIIVASST